MKRVGCMAQRALNNNSEGKNKQKIGKHEKSVKISSRTQTNDETTTA